MVLNRSTSDPFPPLPFPHANWEGFEHWLLVVDFEGEHLKGNIAQWWLERLCLIAIGHVAILVFGKGSRNLSWSKCLCCQRHFGARHPIKAKVTF